MAPETEQAKTVVVFAYDSGDAAQARRIRSLIDLGHRVKVYSFRRRNGSSDFKTDFDNVHLGWTHHGRLGERMVLILGAMLRMFLHRRIVGQADIILARNLDMLAVAWVAKVISGARTAPLVYECLDIHPSLVGPGWKARIMRAAERFFLARSALLGVSSPAYLRHYFEPVQGYHGPTALWENKVQYDAALPARPQSRPTGRDGPIRIGLVGQVRCRVSLNLLAETTTAMGGAAELHIHGRVQNTALPDFDALAEAAPYVHMHGPYSYPQDLIAIYNSIDLIWNADFLTSDANSKWALSNRVYEASWCGCPSVGVANTEIGRIIAERRLGWVLPGPEVRHLEALLRSLNFADIEKQGASLLSQDEAGFLSRGEEMADLIRRVPA